jgi:hypothetical protein
MNYQCDENAKLAPVLDQGSVRSEVDPLGDAVGQDTRLNRHPSKQKFECQPLNDRDTVEKQRIKR